ncbi:anillin-like isoform X2 [Rhynchophorus ferrugineus]|uniref:anillin-like isoform X2 n=1 Tax=Rhynchophorus ferrugineus TaxID=354439 RepID=UPI003FCCA4EB
MDQIKILVKDILYKIQDIPDIGCPTVRMSEVRSRVSLTSAASGSLATPQDIDEHTSNTDGKVKPDNDENVAVSAEQNGASQKESTAINPGGSKESVCSVSRSPKHRPRRPRIIMGKKALIRDQQRSQCSVIHQLVNVNDKYEDQLTDCINRIYHRRVSRDSRSTDDDGASSNYSAGSLRTINTPDDLYDGRSYFSLLFPTKSDNEFDFLHSTDDLNKDTSAEDTFLDSTIVSIDLEYDAKKFLKDALGDVSLDTQSLDPRFHSTRMCKSQNLDSPSKSTILSKAGSIYSSMRKSIRRACSFRDKSSTVKDKNCGKSVCQSFTPGLDPSDENLMQELFVQNGVIFQASKALSYCKDTGNFGSPAHIEAEKILLVATCTKEAVQAAIEISECIKSEKQTDRYSGTLQLSNIVYYLKGDIVTEVGTKKDFDEYFVVIVRCGKTVLSSRVLTADKNGEVKVGNKFVLNGLRTSFDMTVSVYSMKVGHVDNGEDAKSQHKKDRKTKPCPSPRSFFQLHHTSSRRSLYIPDASFSIKPSAFTLWGMCNISCTDRHKTHFRMHHVPLCSSLEGYFTASLVPSVELTNKSTGFLTIGTEKTHLVWNRRWCMLEGPILKYWNYPSEESSSDPIGAIDLGQAMEEVIPADRSLCPRPKTLHLLIKGPDDLIKYFLSADTLEEKEKWFEEISFVIGTLKAWGRIDCTEL